MPGNVLFTAVVLIACLLCNRLSNKLGIPMLLAFILLGMFFGSDGLLKIPFDNYIFAEQICSVALIFIMFYGGFCTKWSEARPIAVKSILLSSLGVIMTALITGLFCHYALHIELLESFLIGSVISSTDAASVFSILRSRRLNLKYNTASMLELESGSNDPTSYMLTVLSLAAMSGTVDGKKMTYLIFAQVVYGVIFGVLVSIIAVWVLRRFRFATAGFDAIFVFAIALVAYAAPAMLNGNGYLSAYIVGIILGNQPIKNKKALVNFFDGFTGLMQMVIFFLLGLLAFPSSLPKVMVPSILIALFLTFVSRPVAVFAILMPFRSKLNQQLLVAWSGLRGAASIVFAIMVMTSPVKTNNDIFHIVFCIVLFSILLQGSLIPVFARKLNMIDSDSDVLKTFTDYTGEVPVQFIKFTVIKDHPWKDMAVKDIVLPPDTLLVLLQRHMRKYVPNGDTILQEGDVLVLSAKALDGFEETGLSEIFINRDSKWVGKTVSEMSIEPDELVVMIQRKGEIIIPSGSTVMEQEDILVVNQM